ncbi:MAG: UvrD-helicase domain-containing protein, partial [Actinomycetia bacterium]|nr:UvrD-helicase domain-containing protein [Actinomycetes bacterium]
MSNILKNLNKEQQEAVLHTDGPLLVLAGAGSGKTRVITSRIAYLIKEKGVSPRSILGVTFTNKAAGEMEERIYTMLEYKITSVWLKTFHSTGARLLREHIPYLNRSKDFSIYSDNDSKNLIKDIIKRFDLRNSVKPGTVLSLISRMKDNLVSVKECGENVNDPKEEDIFKIYSEYEKNLRKNNAVDFGDLLFLTVQLLRNVPELLESLQEKWRYILVDEYQDTNKLQGEIVDLTASFHCNIMVVGDDSQSIYSFRGAHFT